METALASGAVRLTLKMVAQQVGALKEIQRLKDLISALFSPGDVIKAFEEEIDNLKDLLDREQEIKHTPEVKQWMDKVQRLLKKGSELIVEYPKAFFLKKAKIVQKIGEVTKELQKHQNQNYVILSLGFQILHNVNQIAHRLEEAVLERGQREETVMPNLQPITKHLFGVDSTYKKVKEFLFASDGCMGMGIHGMGGSGKTTLVKKIYNDTGVREHFDNQIYFVTVSQNATYESLCKQVFEAISFEKDVNPNLVRIKLIYLVKNMTYLLILDNVWESRIMPKFMDEIVKDMKGKVVFTARNVDIPGNMESIPMCLLGEEDSWSLFCAHAFQRPPPMQINEWAMKITKACKGLPLALEVLGRAMAGKQADNDVWIWENAWNHLEAKQVFDKDQVISLYSVLEYSYDQLGVLQRTIGDGANFQQCFLYFKAFPEDYDIDVSIMFKCWEAENFLGSTKLDIQMQCQRVLLNLINSALIEGIRCSFLNGNAICKIHDTLRDLTFYISNNEARTGEHAKLDLVLDRHTIKHFNPENIIWERIQRISVISPNQEFVLPEQCLPNLLVFLAIEAKTIIMPDVCRGGWNKLRLLYLQAKYWSEEEPSHSASEYQCPRLQLPSSLGKKRRLSSLEQIYLSGWMFKDFPKVEHGGLRCLHRLCLTTCSSLQNLPRNLGRPKIFSCLEVLTIANCMNLRSFPDVELGGLEKLKKLSLIKIGISRLPKSLGKRGYFPSLETLTVALCTHLHEFPSIEPGGLQKIRQLSIAGFQDADWKHMIQAIPVSFPCLEELCIASGILDLRSRRDEFESFQESDAIETRDAISLDEQMQHSAQSSTAHNAKYSRVRKVFLGDFQDAGDELKKLRNICDLVLPLAFPGYFPCLEELYIVSTNGRMVPQGKFLNLQKLFYLDLEKASQMCPCIPSSLTMQGSFPCLKELTLTLDTSFPHVESGGLPSLQTLYEDKHWSKTHVKLDHYGRLPEQVQILPYESNSFLPYQGKFKEEDSFEQEVNNIWRWKKSS